MSSTTAHSHSGGDSAARTAIERSSASSSCGLPSYLRGCIRGHPAWRVSEEEDASDWVTGRGATCCGLRFDRSAPHPCVARKEAAASDAHSPTAMLRVNEAPSTFIGMVRGRRSTTGAAKLADIAPGATEDAQATPASRASEARSISTAIKKKKASAKKSPSTWRGGWRNRSRSHQQSSHSPRGCSR